MRFQLLSLAVVALLFISSQVEAHCTKTYKVKKDDTCRKIRTKYHLSKAKFAKLNPKVNCGHLHTGTKVCVAGKKPKPQTGCKSYYVIVSGDSCDLIASKNNETASAVMTDNPTLKCGQLKIGDVTCIGYGKGTLPRLDIPDSQCTVNGTFAITFDDGPYNFTDGLLDYLKANNHTATFFVNGQNFGNIYNYSSTVKRIYIEGHQIAHHTWSHKDIANLTEADIRLEITQLETAFRTILGVIPKYFRPPFGSTNALSLSVLKELGYRVIKWDVSNDDTSILPKDLAAQQTAFNTTLAAAGIKPLTDGHISLGHDTNQITAQQFAPWAYGYVKYQGYKTMTVGECLGVPNRDDWYRK